MKSPLIKNKERIQMVFAGYDDFSKTKYLLSLRSRRKEVVKRAENGSKEESCN